MKVILKRAVILIAIFLIAIAVYFIWFQKEESPRTLYTSLEEAGFPVVSVNMLGREMNHLHGHTSQMDFKNVRESLTVLPEDRKLEVYIEENQETVEALSYEIRSLNGERLIERTQLTEWTRMEDGRISAILPIQNLLTKEREYMLSVIVSTSNQSKLYYDTRIVQTETRMAQEMVDLAVYFSDCTFDSQKANELTTYLETDSGADNSSLGRVSIQSSFSQITWRNLGMQRISPVYAELSELNGNLATIKLRYVVAEQAQTENVGAETGSEGEETANTEASENGGNGTSGIGENSYEIIEDFTLRWSSQRIYMMDYNRSMNQIFSGDAELFSGKRIILGITDGENLQVMTSPSKRYTSFLANRELWTYDSEENQAFKVFTFRDNGSDELRHGFEQHKIKLLQVSDDGNIDFLVYGYMNRGEHEGQCGITYYQYDSESGVLREKFFVESTQAYEFLKEDVARLSYLSSRNVLYLYYENAIYGIDLTSGEYLVIADALTDDSFCVSEDKTMLAWQDSSDLLNSHVIHIMNLETGDKREIVKEQDTLLRTLGFVDNDIVYGLAHEEDQTYIYGQLAEIPMYALEVADETTEIAAHYEKEGLYLTDVSVEGSRIHMMRSVKNADGTYTKKDEDTLINNEEKKEETSNGIGWYTSEDRGRVYYVSLPTEIAPNKKLSYQAPERVEKELNADLVLKSNKKGNTPYFYAYAGGRLLGKYTKFSDAVQLAYEHMGIVTDQNQNVLWMRGNRSASKTIRSPQEIWMQFEHDAEEFLGTTVYEDGRMLLDARDCTLEQVLFYVDKGYPVIAVENGAEYCLIVGYDSTSVQIYDVFAGETTRMSMEEASSYFESCGNNYVCLFFTNA